MAASKTYQHNSAAVTAHNKKKEAIHAGTDLPLYLKRSID